jgi:predicted MFS family arabinose efflux permease
VNDTPTVPGPAAGRRERLVTSGFVLVTLSTFAYFMAIGALVPTLPRFVEADLGGGSIAVGAAVGVFAVAAALMRPLAGRIGDLRGRRVLVVGGSLLVGLSVLGYTVADDLGVLLTLRLVTGFGEAAMWVGAATAVQDMAPDDRRGEAASYFSVALYAGLAFGPMAGEVLLRRHGFDAVWTAAGLSALVAAVLGLWTPRRPPGHPQPFRLLQRDAIRPGVLLFMGLVPFIGFSAFVALYGPEVDIDDVAALFLLYGVLVLVIRIFGARLPDSLGSRRASSIALGVLGAAGVVLGAWAGAAGVWVATVGLALGMSLLFPALFSAAVAAAPEEERSQAVGTFSLFFDSASGIVPLVMGLVVALSNYRAAFALSGAVALAGLLLVVRFTPGDRTGVGAGLGSGPMSTPRARTSAAGGTGRPADRVGP